MEYRRLGNTDIEVSAICLGTMTYGEQNSEAEGHEQLDAALAAGVNFIDTAELYPVPPMGETQGRTEEIIGTWLKARDNRDKVVLATKAAGGGDWIEHIRSGKTRFDTANLNSAVDDSLKRLQTDYIDLYQLHWPERNTNYFGRLGYQHQTDEGEMTPIAETLTALQKLVDAGKIRHIGLSNETPWATMKFIETAEQLNLPRIVSIQNPYSLLNRSYEVGMAEISHREQAGLLAYSPLGFGVLSGKYLNGAKPEGARITLWERFGRYTSPEGIAATEAYVALAREHGLDPAQMALAYVTGRSFLTSNIIGATTMAQLESNLASAELRLSDELLEQIEQIHKRHTYPSP